MSDETQTPLADDPATNPAAEETAAASQEGRIAQLETELQAAKEQVLRAMAEAENTRKRAEKQIADERVYAIEKFARELLSVSDNMSRALEALSEDARAGLSEPGAKLLEGVEMTQKELHAAFARGGVVAIDAAPGAEFDPNLHQAVSQIPSEQPTGTVASVFQTGWKIKDRVLRAALVAVSAGPAN